MFLNMTSWFYVAILHTAVVFRMQSFSFIYVPGGHDADADDDSDEDEEEIRDSKQGNLLSHSVMHSQ